MLFCDLRSIFGKERDGVHKYRDPFFDTAIVDTILTILGSIIISYFFKINIIKSLIILFVLSILLHYLFCVETTTNKFIQKTIFNIVQIVQKRF